MSKKFDLYDAATGRFICKATKAQVEAGNSVSEPEGVFCVDVDTLEPIDGRGDGEGRRVYTMPAGGPR